MTTGNDVLISRVAERAALTAALEAALGGATRLVTIAGPEGSGRRSLVSGLLADAPAAERPVLPVRVSVDEGEDGLRIMLRLYAALYTGIDRIGAKEGVGALLTERQAQEGLSEPMKLWLKALEEGLAKDIPDTATASFQVTVPRASPYLGLVELLLTLSERYTLLLEVADAQNVLSFGFWTFLSSVVGRLSRAPRGALVVVGHTGLADDDGSRSLAPQLSSWLETLPTALEAQHLTLLPFTADETAELMHTRHPGLELPQGFAARLTELSRGLPGPAVEILERLKEQQALRANGDGKWHLDVGAAALEASSLLPPLPDGDEAKLRRALQVAALEGRTFTSSVVAEALETPQDDVDDLLDELEDHITEVVFHEGLKSWLYRFNSPMIQRQILAGLGDHARKEQARLLADLLERKYVMRAQEFATKAARLWHEAGDTQRTARMVSMASSMERVDVLQMAYEVFHTDPESAWSRPLARGMMLSLLEKISAGGNPTIGLQVADGLERWAATHKLEDLAPWVAQYRARFLLRNNRPEDAAARAEEARKGFARAGNVLKEAETLALQANVEMGRGQIGAAMEYAQRSLKASDFPPVTAQARFVKGVVHKTRGELNEAVEELRQALDLTARTGMFPLHADAGLNLAETLLMGNNAPQAMGLLQQLLTFTRAQRMQARERGCLSLLGKAHAALQDYTQASTFTADALKIARATKNRLGEAADLFDLGLFSYLRQSLDEAEIYLKEAEIAARELRHAPLMTEILFHKGLVASALKDLDRARAAYEEAEGICRQVGNERRLANLLFNLGAIYLHQETLDKARRYLDEARPLVEKYGSEDEKKGMRRAQRQLDEKLH